MIRNFLLVGAFSLFSATAHALPLPLGSPGPDVTAKDLDGHAIRFVDVYAKGPTLVFFYSKTAGIGVVQACSLRDSYDALKARGLQIIGVSCAPAAAQKELRDAKKLPFPLVVDTDGKVADAFQVPTTGDGSSLQCFRRSFLIKDGKLAWWSALPQSVKSGAEIQKTLDDLK